MPGTTETVPSERADAAADAEAVSPVEASSLAPSGAARASGTADAGAGFWVNGLCVAGLSVADLSVAGLEAAFAGLAGAGELTDLGEAGAELAGGWPAADGRLVAGPPADPVPAWPACFVVAGLACAAIDAGRAPSSRAGLSLGLAAWPGEALPAGVKNGDPPPADGDVDLASGARSEGPGRSGRSAGRERTSASEVRPPAAAAYGRTAAGWSGRARVMPGWAWAGCCPRGRCVAAGVSAAAVGRGQSRWLRTR